MGVLELLPPGWDDANIDKTRRNFERIGPLLEVARESTDGAGFTIGGVGARFGSFSGTTSGTGELTVTVTHGLGKTPTAAVATTNSSSGTQITARAINLTATTFDVYVVRSAAAAVAVGGYWAVMG